MSRQEQPNAPVQKHSTKKDNSKKSRQPWIIGLAVLLVVLVFVGASWAIFSKQQDPVGEPAPSPKLEIVDKKIPADLSVGVVVSYTEDPSEGRGWDLAGEGAQVAAWRLEQGGKKVNLPVASDQGSEDGSVKAIEELKAQGATAIVALTSGAHTDTLAQAAFDADLPIVFPYQVPKAEAPAGAWYAMPSEQGLKELISDRIAALGCESPIIFKGTQPQFDGIKGTEITIGAEGVEKSVEELVKHLGEKTTENCIILDTDPVQSAQIIQGLHGLNITVATIGGPALVNPLFTQTLGDNAEVLNNVYAVGTPSAMGISMTPGSHGARAAVFERAVAIMSQDPELASVTGDDFFQNRADFADTASHDALLAIVKAIAIAGSSDASDISEAMGSVSLEPNDGFASEHVAFVEGGEPVGIVQALPVVGGFVWANPAED